MLTTYGYSLCCSTCLAINGQISLYQEFGGSNRSNVLCYLCFREHENQNENIGKPATKHKDITCTAQGCVSGKITKSGCIHEKNTEHYHCAIHGDVIAELH